MSERTIDPTRIKAGEIIGITTKDGIESIALVGSVGETYIRSWVVNGMYDFAVDRKTGLSIRQYAHDAGHSSITFAERLPDELDSAVRSLNDKLRLVFRINDLRQVSRLPLDHYLGKAGGLLERRHFSSDWKTRYVEFGGVPNAVFDYMDSLRGKAIEVERDLSAPEAFGTSDAEHERGPVSLTQEQVHLVLDALFVASLEPEVAIAAFRTLFDDGRRAGAGDLWSALDPHHPAPRGEVTFEVSRQEIRDIEDALYIVAQDEASLESRSARHFGKDRRIRSSRLHDEIELRLPLDFAAPTEETALRM